eukprot:g33880.t1
MHAQLLALLQNKRNHIRQLSNHARDTTKPRQQSLTVICDLLSLLNDTLEQLRLCCETEQAVGTGFGTRPEQLQDNSTFAKAQNRFLMGFGDIAGPAFLTIGVVILSAPLIINTVGNLTKGKPDDLK